MSVRSPEVSAPAQPRLTKMEARLLRLISLDCTVKQAAAILGRDVATAKTLKLRLIKKLKTHNRALLTRRALELGVSSPDDALTPQEQRLAGFHRPIKPR